MEERLLSHLVRDVREETEFASADLQRLWESVDPYADPAVYPAVEDAFLAALGAETEAPLRFGGGWKVKVSGNAFRAALTGALIAGALMSIPVPGIPAVVLPAVIPLLFEVERSRLKRSEEIILLELVYKDEARDKMASELYELLPPAMKEDVSRLDFENFLAACHDAGLADETSRLPGDWIDRGPRYTLRPPGSPRFRVKFV